jgi:hypothetical protein
MGRVRRGGYIFDWWIGDHDPRHVHVSDGNGNLLGRVAVDDFSPLDEWHPPRKVVEILKALKEEGRL